MLLHDPADAGKAEGSLESGETILFAVALPSSDTAEVEGTLQLPRRSEKDRNEPNRLVSGT